MQARLAPEVICHNAPLTLVQLYVNGPVPVVVTQSVLPVDPQIGRTVGGTSVHVGAAATVTVNEHEALLQASDAEQFTVVVPTGKVLPDAGVHELVGEHPPES